MSLYASLIGLMAGICLAFGILHLFIGLRSKAGRRLHLFFSIFAWGYGGTLLLGVAYHQASTIESFVTLNRWDALFVPAAFIGLVWYVSIYTSFGPRPLIWGLTAAFVSVGLAQLLRPSLLFETIESLAFAELPWGERLAYLEGTPSLWETVFTLGQLITVGYMVLAGLIQFRRGQRQAASFLILGFTGFVLALVIEVAGTVGFIPYIPVAEVAFIGIAIAVSLQMAADVIETSEELERYSNEQEKMVAARTAELEQSNRDLTLQIQERQRAMQEVRESERRFQILHEIAVSLSGQTDLPAALHSIGQRISSLFDARYLYIVLGDPKVSEQAELLRFEKGSSPDGARIPTYDIDRLPQIREVLLTRQTQLLSNIDHESIDPDAQSAGQQGRLANVLLVPLLTGQSAAGCLLVATDENDNPLSPADVDLAETVASDVALAVFSARLASQAQETAVIEERNRLARDLHDAVTQTIYSAALIAEALPRTWERNPLDGQRNLAKLRQLVRGALAELRSLLFELRPSALKAADLESLLSYLGDAFTSRTRVPVTTSFNGGDTLPHEVKMGLYRIAQEAFNNTEKHAGASEASLSLDQSLDRVRLVLHDNGRGFDPQNVPLDRMGLQIMRERVAMMDGQMELESGPKRGTSLTIVVPLSADDAAGVTNE